MSALGHETRRLFQCLRRRWLPEPQLQEGFLKTLDGYNELQGKLSTDRDLDRLSRQMYPDLKGLIRDRPVVDDNAADGPTGNELLTVSEVHEILQVIQTMEIAWMNARMEDFDAHPLNRGWVAVFHRWSMMPAFRRLWPVLRADFSRSFVEYCESRFALRVTYLPLEKFPSRSAISDAEEKCQTSQATLDAVEEKLATDRELPSQHQSSQAARAMAKLIRDHDFEKQRLALLNRKADKLRYGRECILREFECEWPEVGRSFFDDPRCLVWYARPSIRGFELNSPQEADEADSAIDCWKSPVPLGFVALMRPAPGRVRLESGCDNRSCDHEAPELRFWVRPQYRFLGVGRHLLEQFALRALESDCPRRFRRPADRPTAAENPWSDTGPLVTRYLVRTGQEGGYGLRRRMQLGFLYEYSFARQDDRPLDELPPAKSNDEPHPSLRGIRSPVAGRVHSTVVPTILKTNWHAFFEAARSMSVCPRQFDQFIAKPKAN